MTAPEKVLPVTTPGLRFRWSWVYTDGFNDQTVFDGDTAISLTGSTAYPFMATVAAGTTVTIWTLGVPLPGTFTALYMETSGIAVDVEFDVNSDAGGGLTRETFTQRLAIGVPLILGNDASYADVTPGDAIGTGTLDTIERIRVKEPNVAAGTVRGMFVL